MQVKFVYGAPCSGKSSYVKENTGDNDLVFDYDRILKAVTNRVYHSTEPHVVRWNILSLRKNFLDFAKENDEVENFWIICDWKTDYINKLLEDVEVEEIFMDVTKAECYERLEKDETRPDKEKWRAIIDDWFNKHSDNKVEEVGKMNKFWKWIKNEGERELRIDGIIAEESWYDDEISPKDFRAELNSGSGNITLWLNSYGGDVFAASQIYTMLKDYKGEVHVKIDGIAASAASVIAMAGDKISMAATAVMMIHDPSTLAWGNIEEMKSVLKMLDEIKESIISAYELKTGLPRDKISKMMTAETWLNAQKAVELKFADEILFSDSENKSENLREGVIYSRLKVTNSLIGKMKNKMGRHKTENRIAAGQFYKRLNLIAPYNAQKSR